MAKHYACYSTQHADAQIFDRYGIIPSRALWRDVFLDLLAGKTLLLARHPSGCERHLARVQNELVYLIYAPMLACFLTALPPNCRVLARDRKVVLYDE
jgi:hypothetical protein